MNLGLLFFRGFLAILSCLNPFGIVIGEKKPKPVLVEEGIQLYEDSEGYYAVSARATVRVTLEDAFLLETDEVTYLIGINEQGLCSWDFTTNEAVCFLKGTFLSCKGTIMNGSLLFAGTVTSSLSGFFYPLEEGDGTEDAYLIMMDKLGVPVRSKLFSGGIDEAITDILLDESLYIIGWKGAGGSGSGITTRGSAEQNGFLAELDSETLAISICKVLPDNPSPLELITYDDELVIRSAEGLAFYERNLSYRGSLNSLNPLALYPHEDLLWIFYPTSAVPLDSKTMTTLGQVSYPESKAIHFRDDAFILLAERSEWQAEIYDLSAFYLPEPYVQLEENLTVNGLHGACTCQGTPLNDFKPLVNGTYERVFVYEATSGDTFQVKRTQTVAPYENVHEGGIYPVGYRLRFTGNATLDGIAVANGSLIQSVGCHELVLTSNEGARRIITFSTSKEALEFRETFGYRAVTTSTSELLYRLSRKVDEVSVNGSLMKTETDDESCFLRLTLSAPGLYYYSIAASGSEVDDFHETIAVLRTCAAPTVTLSSMDGRVRAEIDDEDGTARKLRLVVNQGKDIALDYPLASCRLAVSGISPAKALAIEAYLVVDLGDQVEREVLLARYEGVASKSAGIAFSLTVLSTSSIVNELRLEAGGIFSTRDDLKASYKNETFYVRKGRSVFACIMVVLSCFALGSGGTILFFKKKHH